MNTKPSSTIVGIVAAAVVVLSALVAYLLYTIPAVKGLGDKVKLPLFHGASTWVDLMLFVLHGHRGRRLPGHSARLGLRLGGRPARHRGAALAGQQRAWPHRGAQHLGLHRFEGVAALGGDAGPAAGRPDAHPPRVAMLLLLDWLVLEKRAHKAIADIIFVIVGVVLLSDIFLDPAKRALHPDSPVLNSGFEIKGPFFGIVLSILGITLLLSWLVSRYVGPEKSSD